MAKEKGEPIPEFDLPEKPRVRPHIDLYFACFMDTSTERSLGMSVGPIPYYSVMRWADMRDMSMEEADDMWSVLTNVDGMWMKRVNEDGKRNHTRSRKKS